MSPKHKALAAALFCLVVARGLGGCSSSLTSNETQQLATETETETESGQEEVLDQDDDSFGEPEEAGAEGKAGGILMSLSYLIMTLGSAVLPFLALM